MFPEQIVVRGRKILFVIARVLPDLRRSLFRYAIHRIFIFCPVGGIGCFFVVVHSDAPFFKICHYG